LSRFKRQSGNGRIVHAWTARRLRAPAQTGRGLRGQEQMGPAKGVPHLYVRARTVLHQGGPAPRVPSVGRAAWRAPSLPAAASRARAVHGLAASLEKRAEGRMGQAPDAVRELGAVRVRRSARSRPAATAEKGSSHAAKTRARSAEPGPAGSPSRHSAARASRGRAGSQSLVPKASRAVASRVVPAPSAAVLVQVESGRRLRAIPPLPEKQEPGKDGAPIFPSRNTRMTRVWAPTRPSPP